MFDFDSDVVIPIMIFSIPIIAIVGGITAGIVKTLGRQRLVELAQQERIAAIQRGIDISKLPPLPSIDDADDVPFATAGTTPADRDRRRSQGLLIGGIIALFVGGGLMAFLSVMDGGDSWAVGIIPASVGAALLLSAWLVRPRPN